jgi:hypothetical protein
MWHMSETPKPLFENFEQAEQYVESVREHYREGHGEYRGNRSEEQQLIAEVTSDEARLIVDGAMAGILAMGATKLPNDYDSKIERADSTWADFRGEFEKSLVGFGVITNRLHRDGYEVPEYAELGLHDRMKAASVIFSDFLSHNALRFGVDTAGVPKTERKKVYTDDGGVETISKIVDKDKAKNEREINENMAKRKYRAGIAAHQALKISPDEYKKLRREYPEMDKDDFDTAVSAYIDVRGELESRE